MSKFLKALTCALVIAGAVAMMPGPAAARGWHGFAVPHWHGGIGYRHWRGGFPGIGWYGWRRHNYRPWGPAYALGLGIPFLYAVPYYYTPDSCGWVRVPHWRNHHRVWVSAWRCW